MDCSAPAFASPERLAADVAETVDADDLAGLTRGLATVLFIRCASLLASRNKAVNGTDSRSCPAAGNVRRWRGGELPVRTICPDWESSRGEGVIGWGVRLASNKKLSFDVNAASPCKNSRSECCSCSPKVPTIGSAHGDGTTVSSSPVEATETPVVHCTVSLQSWD